jgi:hypothetical protein
MNVINGHSELPTAIRCAERGSIVRVATATLKELGERAAARMGRSDLEFTVASEEEFAADAVPDLMALLTDPDPKVRWAACEVLVAVGPAAVPALIEARRNPVGHVRFYAAEAIDLIGAAAVPALRDALRDAAWRVRYDAVVALGRIGLAAVAAVPDLMGLLTDEDPDVCDVAAAALRLIRPADETGAEA